MTLCDAYPYVVDVDEVYNIVHADKVHLRERELNPIDFMPSSLPFRQMLFTFAHNITARYVLPTEEDYGGDI